MRNYISVNAKYYKMGEIDRISNHNFRQSKIDYLLPPEQIKFQNQNIIFDENLNVSKGDLSLETLDINMRKQFAKLLKLKQDILKKNNAKHRKNENQLIEMVVALSEEQALNYLENGVDLMAGFKNFAKDIYKKHGLKPLGISLHLDEGNIKDNVTKLNIHGHLTFFNYHFEKEKSVLRTLKKQDFKEMQDIAANSFQKAGLNFIRGEGKEITNKKHLERNDFILSQQNQQIESYDLILKSLIPSINEEKKDLKALLNTFNKGSVEYNLVHNLVGSTMTLEKELRKYSKIEDFNEKNKAIIVKILNKHLEEVKPLVGKNFHKAENLDVLVNHLEKFAQKISGVNLEFTQNQKKDKKIEELEKELNKEREQKSVLLDKLNEERSKNKALSIQNKTLEQNEAQNLAQNQKLLQGLEKQQKMIQEKDKMIQKKDRTNIRRRNQMRLLLQKFMKDNNLTSIMQTRKFLRDSKNRDLNKGKITKTQENHNFER